MTIQRRLEKRINVDFDLEVYELIISDKPLVLPNTLRMKVLNVSASGILLFSNLQFDVGVHFGTVLEFDNQKLFAACVVVRKERSNTGFNYGCALLGVSEADQSRIRQFVFKEEIQQRRRLKKEQDRTVAL